MLRWFARNDIASNLLMAAILLFGLYSAFERVPLEVQPSIRFNQVRIDVSYRGGSPKLVERNVVVPIERALENLPGIDRIRSEARAGSAEVILYATDTTDPKDLLEEAQTRVDAITTFPQETEPARIRIPDSSRWFDVIKVVVAGNMDAYDLLRAARRVRDDLTELPGISQANVVGAGRFEISIEADPARLRDFGLSFADLTDAVRRSSVDLPAGSIQTDEGNLLIRSKGQAYERKQFEDIVIRNNHGAEVKLGAVARVIDGFERDNKLTRFDGKPCLLVEVLRLDNENALEIAAEVKDYVSNQKQRFPVGISLDFWDDSSVELQGRLGTLLRSLLQGSLLVLIVLSLFLRPSIAFWVVLGIPVSFAGGLILMPTFGITANVMSIFGFIIVVGLVVDDAIVTSENIYIKLRSQSGPPLDAVVRGAKEVAVPVTFGMLTTVVAFLPLLFFTGFYGNYTRQIPPVVAAVLFFSLVESKLILPSHLKFVRVHRTELGRFARFQKAIADGLERFVEKIYRPALVFATRNRYLTLATFGALGLACLGVIQSGRMGFVNMPSIDRNKIIASVKMPRDTPVAVTDRHVRRIEAAIESLREEFRDPGTGQSLIGDILTSSGGWSGSNGFDSRRGFVCVNILDPGQRSVPGPRNSEIARRWKEKVGNIPEAEHFRIWGDRGGGFHDNSDLESIEIEVRGENSEEKGKVIDEIEHLLESYPGIESAWTDYGRSRDELIITIRPEGESLGLTQRDLARQVRAAFFGEQAQRIQRGRDDIRVMVRLPRKQRESLDTLEQLRIRTPGGGLAPFRSVAEARFEKAPAEIKRMDGAEVVSIYAQPKDETIDIIAISKDLAPRIGALVAHDPTLSWRYQGYIAEHRETRRRVWFGAASLLLALFALLAIPFRSVVQPFYVLVVIPFGVIGALLGHWIMDLTPSYLSIFGMLALAGVVVNDSLVMVDFINQHRRAGDGLFESLIGSGTRRFRPIILTSLTTFAGLVPLIFDPSRQGQFLIPMAVSLAFGILFATFITLFLVPATYHVGEDILGILRNAGRWFARPWKPQT